MTTAITHSWILERSSGKQIAAQVHPSILQETIAEWEAKWVPESLKLALALIAADHRLPAKELQSLHWNWRQKMSSIKGLLSYPSYRLEAGGSLEGLMILDLDKPTRLPSAAGKPLVYIQYLENAPWNRATAVSLSRYRGIGGLMVAVATSRSVDEEYGGRLGLHSLPQSDGFYSKIGMSDLGPDPQYQNLRYFEFTEPAAVQFLKHGGAQ